MTMKGFLRLVAVILLVLLSGCTSKLTPVNTFTLSTTNTSNTPGLSSLGNHGTISGTVVDSLGAPLSQATERIQATTNQTLTADDGSFILSGLEDGVAITVSAWKEGYYCAKYESAKPPVVGIILKMRQVQTTDNANYEWIAPIGDGSCYSCKPGVTQVWLDNDAHGKSATNIRFLSMYNGTDVNGNQSPLTQYGNSPDYGAVPLLPDLSQPYYGPGYKLNFPNTAGNCAACHLPGAAIDAPYDTDPNTAEGVDTFGIHCDYCHKVADVKLDPATNLPFPNMPGVLSQIILRPFSEDKDRYQIFFGSFDDDNVPMEDTYLPLIKESSWCAPCHYGVFWNTVIYNSYGEWLESPYSDPVSGKTCQQCHMATPTLLNGETITNVAPGKGGVERDPKTIPAHTFQGASNLELLQNAVEMDVTTSRSSNRITVTVTLVNDKTGHDVPTDSPLRQMILLVRVDDTNGNPLDQVEGFRIPISGGVGEPVEGYYSGWPGKIFSKVLSEIWTEITPTGAYWNPVRVISDNRLKALESDTSTYLFKSPQDGNLSVNVKLLYRRAFIELMDQKGWKVPDIVMEEKQIDIH
ncbi:MAG: hypothetical protein C3F13_03090 [Anaerolineales bacterium]|nr:MAG: hypothetical protein C3F13_03090 [Anaerolineales bacterium]